MRAHTCSPDRIRPRDLAELKRLQDQFLDSITENPEETAYREECHRRWVESTRPKRRACGATD